MQIGANMSFLDELGDSISDVAKDVTGKAKELGNNARIYANIKAEELKIQEQYYKLGKRYYSLYQETGDPELLDLIDAISVSNDKIAKYREELDDMKTNTN